MIELDRKLQDAYQRMKDHEEVLFEVKILTWPYNNSHIVDIVCHDKQVKQEPKLVKP